jgi:hypothetical protein
VKLRKPVILHNPSRDRLIEVIWNLPVQLDVLTEFAYDHAATRKVADKILDAASALAYAKGLWNGQESIQPILDEVEHSFFLVSSDLFKDPHIKECKIYDPDDIERNMRVVECMRCINEYISTLAC